MIPNLRQNRHHVIQVIPSFNPSPSELLNFLQLNDWKAKGCTKKTIRLTLRCGNLIPNRFISHSSNVNRNRNITIRCLSSFGKRKSLWIDSGLLKSKIKFMKSLTVINIWMIIIILVGVQCYVLLWWMWINAWMIACVFRNDDVSIRHVIVQKRKTNFSHFGSVSIRRIFLFSLNYRFDWHLYQSTANTFVTISLDFRATVFLFISIIHHWYAVDPKH